MKCRHCNSKSFTKLVDLGFSPPSNAYLSNDDLRKPKIALYLLVVNVCLNCWLVQTEDYTNAEDLFDDQYAYFSSTSSSWLAHAKKFVYETAIPLGVSQKSLVVEIASNDGYLLKNFVELGIPCLGIEPTESTAKVSLDLGYQS